MRLIILLYLFSIQALASVNFPVEGTVRTRVDFWKKVYTEITSQQGFIHDAADLSFIYAKIDLPKGRRARIRKIKKEKRKIVTSLRSILKKDFKDLNQEELRILSLTEDKSQEKIRSMIKNIRLQGGLKDRYYQGLIRSYKYMDYIKSTFARYGLPDELVFLPHVESSFNYEAYSKVGAAGIWQFMRSTARSFGLKVGYIIDERRDPLKATVAAAKLLRTNYRKLESWPLALTAYNHGARSMQRAVAKLGTKNIATIIENYKGRRFGFASKNFYATFMATVEISQEPEKYFPTFKKPAKFEYSVIPLKRSYQVQHLTKTLEIPRSQLRAYNPAIRRIAYNTPLFLPKGLNLQIPKVGAKELAALETKLSNLKIPKSDMELEKMHIVSRGESLFTIAQVYRVDMGKIIQFNQLSDPRRIYPGMKLKIPGEKSKVPVVAVAKISKPPKPTQKNKTSVEDFSLPSLEVEELARKKPKEIGFTDKVKNYFSQWFNEEEYRKEQIAKNEAAMRESRLNLSSYKLDLTYISPDIFEVTVETEETLGHFGEWAKTPTQVIRDLNGFGSRSSIQLGQKIKVRIFTEQLSQFKNARNEYHLSIQEDFYDKFSVFESTKYVVKSGDNLSALLNEYDLPYWLLRKVQPGGKLKTNLNIGDLILIPKVSSNQGESEELTDQ